MDVVNTCDYVPTYQHKDADWMLLLINISHLTEKTYVWVVSASLGQTLQWKSKTFEKVTSSIKPSPMPSLHVNCN